MVTSASSDGKIARYRLSAASPSDWFQPKPSETNINSGMVTGHSFNGIQHTATHSQPVKGQRVQPAPRRRLQASHPVVEGSVPDQLISVRERAGTRSAYPVSKVLLR
jgi:hypothetical protein